MKKCMLFLMMIVLTSGITFAAAFAPVNAADNTSAHYFQGKKKVKKKMHHRKHAHKKKSVHRKKHVAKKVHQ